MLKLPPAPLGIFYELTRDYHTCVADERVNIYAPDGKLLVALIPGMSRLLRSQQDRLPCGYCSGLIGAFVTSFVSHSPRMYSLISTAHSLE
jgi:hypothetical protein